VRGMWYQGQKDQWVDIVHAIVENEKRAKGSSGDYRMDAPGMRFQSVYYERGGEPDRVLMDSRRKSVEQREDDKKSLRIGGFRDFPVLTAHWYRNSEDVWGRGWAMDALGDARALQLQQRRKAQAIDKLVDPPMVAHPSLRNQRTSLLAGDVTFVAPEGNDKVGFAPAYEIRPDLQGILEDIKETQERIKSLGYADIFAMFIQAEQTNQPITAAEVNAKQQEKLLMLGPVLEQLNGMFNDLHHWLFVEGLRHGKYPPPPPAMRGQKIKVTYTSILAQAINAITAQSIEKFTTYIGTIAQMTAEGSQNPAMDKADFDVMIEEYGKATNIPPECVRSDADVEKIRAQRQQQQEQEQQQEQAAQQAQNMQAHATAANKLGTTPGPGGQGSVLDQLAQATGAAPVGNQ
jgi:hypothetical protein